MIDRGILVRRAEIIRQIREFFDKSGFIEVDTPVRIAAPAPECHIDCPPVATGGFLRASPELQMKKLLALRMDKIYQIGPCFRDGEKGSRHNPEFTMIEWYRREATYLDIMDDLTQLMISLRPSSAAPQKISVREAYQKFAGWDPWEKFDADRFDFDMATKIEPALKDFPSVFLMDYPPACSSLAVVRNGVAERWEYYENGMELANCFTELCNSEEQRGRFEAAKKERAALGEADYPLDEEFFAALPKIGSAAGVALGIDRLIMVLTGARQISDVRFTDL